MSDRPEVDWKPVDEFPPPGGSKVIGLTRHGVMIIGELASRTKLPGPEIICWRELPRKPHNWHELIERMGKEVSHP